MSSIVIIRALAARPTAPSAESWPHGLIAKGRIGMGAPCGVVHVQLDGVTPNGPRSGYAATGAPSARREQSTVKAVTAAFAEFAQPAVHNDLQRLSVLRHLEASPLT